MQCPNVEELSWIVRKNLIERFQKAGWKNISPPLENNILEFIQRMNSEIPEERTTAEVNFFLGTIMFSIYVFCFWKKWDPLGQVFLEKWWKHMEIVATNERDQPVIVIFASKPKIHVGTAEKIIERMESKNIKNAILVYELSVPTKAKNLLVGNKERKIEFLTLCQATLPLMKISGMGRYKKLSKHDKKALIDDFGEPNLLPMMLTSDPVAQYNHYKKGDIIEIQRNIPNVGWDITYRCVTSHTF